MIQSLYSKCRAGGISQFNRQTAFTWVEANCLAATLKHFLAEQTLQQLLTFLKAEMFTVLKSSFRGTLEGQNSFYGSFIGKEKRVTDFSRKLKIKGNFIFQNCRT